MMNLELTNNNREGLSADGLNQIKVEKKREKGKKKKHKQ